MWDQIPFNANEYYMHYLPPGIEPRESEWSESEIAEFQTLLQVCYDVLINSRSTLPIINGVCSLFTCLVEQVMKLLLTSILMYSVNVSLINYPSKIIKLPKKQR